MTSQEYKKLKLPDNPGVYFFMKGKVILYIGKATSLRSRVQSYFSTDLINMRGMFLVDMVTQADNIKWQETDSVLEALILEADLIKTHQPKYNTKEKDGKSFLCVVITAEAMPQVLMVRKKDIDTKNKTAKVSRAKKTVQYTDMYGPFTNGSQLKEAMKIVRRIFPYRDDASSKRDNYEFYKQLGLTPEIAPQEKSSQKVLGSPHENFLPSAKHVRPDHFDKSFPVSLADQAKFSAAVSDKYSLPSKSDSDKSFPATLRIEAYDIAHLSGKDMVGVMTVINAVAPAYRGVQEQFELNKDEYRKFKIKTVSGANDPAALAEVLTRRLGHATWELPNIIVVDGNEVQKNVAEKIIKEKGFNIPVVALVKDDKHKVRGLIGPKDIVTAHKQAITLVNNEAHRFAIAYHKLKRGKSFLN